MESFFLSETCKYLYLLQANTTHLPNHYVFTTEGHLFPPFNASRYPPAGLSNQATAWTHPFQSTCALFLPDFSSLWMPLSDLSSEGSVHSDGPLPPSTGGAVPAAIAERCASVCSSISDADMEEKQRLLQAALPLVPLAAQDAIILRQEVKAGLCWVEPHIYSHCCCQLHAILCCWDSVTAFVVQLSRCRLGNCANEDNCCLQAAQVHSVLACDQQHGAHVPGRRRKP